MVETEREYLERIAGSKIVPYEMKKEALAARAKQGIYQQAIESGYTEEEARQMVGDSGIGSVTPNLDRWQAQSRSQERDEDLGNFKTYGDKSAFEAKNAIRKLQGLPPIPEPLPADRQFLVDLEKSASFGAESALVGDKAPKGQARAFEAGIRAGYSPEQVRKLIADTAARIVGGSTGSQQKEDQQPTPKSPAPQFFEQVYNQFKAPEEREPTPKSPAPQFFEEVYNQFKAPPFFEQAYNQFKTPLEPSTGPKPKSSIGGTASVRWGDLPYNEQTSQAEKYRRLIGEGYTPKQAFQMMGVDPKKAPDWLQGTGVGNIIESINAPE